MANIPIRNIPLEGTPTGSAYFVFDDGQMKKGQVASLADAVRPVASQGEAEAGVDNTKTMTPLRVDQAIASEVGVTLASKAQGDLANTALQPAAIGTTIQAYDADLQAIAALAPADDSFIQRKAGAWANRTVAQVRSDINSNQPYGPFGTVYDSSNLNSIQANGRYSGSSMTNAPDAGFWVVDHLVQGNSPTTHGTQIAYGIGAAVRVYIRTLNSSSWSAWTSIGAAGGNTVRFDTKALATAATELSAEVKFVWLDGYTSVGDAPPARYRLVAAEPTHAGKLQIGTRWYERADDVIDLKQFDDFSAGIYTTSATTAYNRALTYMKASLVKLVVKDVFRFGSQTNSIDFPVTIEFVNKAGAFYRDFAAPAANRGLIELTNSATGTASNSVLKNVHIRATATSSSGCGIGLVPVNPTFGFGNIRIENFTISNDGANNWYTPLYCYGLLQNTGALGIRSCYIEGQVFGGAAAAAIFIGVKHSFIQLQANSAGGTSGMALFDGDATVTSGDLRVDASSLMGVDISNSCSQIVVSCAQCSGNFNASSAADISLFGNCSGTVSANVKWFQRP